MSVPGHALHFGPGTSVTAPCGTLALDLLCSCLVLNT
jgi:hypothetical protein